MKVKLVEHKGEKLIKFWCPGCGEFHVIPENDGEVQQFNGNAESPSMVNPMFFKRDDRLCVVSMKGGLLTFSDDSTHRLAGKDSIMQHEEAWREGGHKWDEVKPVPEKSHEAVKA